MNRWMAIGIATALVLVTPATVRGQHGHGSSNTHATTAHASSAAKHGGSSTHGGGSTHVKSSTQTHATKPSHGSSTHGSSGKTTTTKTAKTESGSSKKNANSTTASTSTSTTATLTPVQLKLQKNTKLANKLESRLPAGTDAVQAAKGFRNLGQFVAAVNVSHNLGIPFATLKTKMVTDGMSLGQAIQTLRPTASATTEVEHAEREADDMIEQTKTTTSTAKKRHHS